jgi:hypothetical protein
MASEARAESRRERETVEAEIRRRTREGVDRGMAAIIEGRQGRAPTFDEASRLIGRLEPNVRTQVGSVYFTDMGPSLDVPVVVATRDIGVGPDLPMADAFGDPTAVGGLGGAGGAAGGNQYMDFLKKVYNVKEIDRDNENPEDLQLVAAFQKKLGLVPRGLYKTPVVKRQAQLVNQFMGGSRNPCDDYLKL